MVGSCIDKSLTTYKLYERTATFDNTHKLLTGANSRNINSPNVKSGKLLKPLTIILMYFNGDHNPFILFILMP